MVLVLDATNGQNALQQIAIFREVAGVTGLVMTKLDGTARGGVLVAAAEESGLPIHAIGVGERIDDLRPFDPALVARVIANDRVVYAWALKSLHPAPSTIDDPRAAIPE